MIRKPYPTDLSDCERELIAALVPESKTNGRPATIARRELLNALLGYTQRENSATTPT